MSSDEFADDGLVSCPMCDGRASLFPHALPKSIRFIPTCEVCGLKGPSFGTKDEARDFWNQRADAQGEAVAWMYTKPNAPIYYKTADAQSLGYVEDGWTETPLYTHPPAQDVAALVDTLRSMASGEILSMSPGPDATEETLVGFRQGFRCAMDLVLAKLAALKGE